MLCRLAVPGRRIVVSTLSFLRALAALMTLQDKFTALSDACGIILFDRIDTHTRILLLASGVRNSLSVRSHRRRPDPLFLRLKVWVIFVPTRSISATRTVPLRGGRIVTFTSSL